MDHLQMLHLGGDAAAAMGAGVLLHKADGLQLLQDVADEAARGASKVLRDGALALVAPAILPPQCAHTQALLDVDLARQRGCGRRDGLGVSRQFLKTTIEGEIRL